MNLLPFIAKTFLNYISNGHTYNNQTKYINPKDTDIIMTKGDDGIYEMSKSK